MKVSFHCILIVTIFSDFTLGEDKINCTSETKSGEICCGGDVYNNAENIWPDESCDVEPKNETLTFADSAWLAYHCNVRKRLNSTDLTLQSYLNLMLRVRNSRQDLFWKAITSLINISKIPGDEEEYAKIQTMKLYHRQYMHAVEQVCTVEVANSTSEIPNFNSTSINLKTRFPGMKYSQRCNEEALPYAAYFAENSFSDTMYDHYKKCLQEFNQTLGKFLFPKYRVSTYVLCRPISSKYLDIKTEMSRPTLDFEGVVSSLSPGFWSKSVKTSVKDWIFEELKQEFQIHDLESVEPLMRKKFEEMVIQEIPEGESVTNNRDLVQALMILHISDIFETTATNLCGFDADRRVNSGV